VRCAHVGCAETVPRRIIPERGQVTEHLGEVPPAARGSESRDVLHEHEPRSNESNDPSILAPERRTGPAEPRSLSGEAEILAGEPAADDVDAGEVLTNGAYVVISNSVWVVSCENASTEFVFLDLPDNVTSGGVLDAKLQAANATEQ